VAVAALMCAKTTLLAVLPQIERKFASWRGGCIVLYRAGWKWAFVADVDENADNEGVYQAIPNPSTLNRRFLVVISASVVYSAWTAGLWESSFGR